MDQAWSISSAYLFEYGLIKFWCVNRLCKESTKPHSDTFGLNLVKTHSIGESPDDKILSIRAHWTRLLLVRYIERRWLQGSLAGESILNIQCSKDAGLFWIQSQTGVTFIASSRLHCNVFSCLTSSWDTLLVFSPYKKNRLTLTFYRYDLTSAAQPR